MFKGKQQSSKNNQIFLNLGIFGSQVATVLAGDIEKDGSGVRQVFQLQFSDADDAEASPSQGIHGLTA